jgi:hypothetical protein
MKKRSGIHCGFCHLPIEDCECAAPDAGAPQDDDRYDWVNDGSGMVDDS